MCRSWSERGNHVTSNLRVRQGVQAKAKFPGSLSRFIGADHACSHMIPELTGRALIEESFIVFLEPA
jgi:hypothetical protein